MMSLHNHLKYAPLTVLGLTGAIASGKSTCARILGQHGVFTIDADRVAHQAYASGSPCFMKIREIFGDAVIGRDGQIDRSVLGKLVFGDAVKMKQLTDLVWPATRALLEAQLQELRERHTDTPNTIVLIEAAVLLEAGWASLVDGVLFVDAGDDATLQTRLQRRHPDMSLEDIQKRLASQTPTATKLQRLQTLTMPFEIVDAAGSIQEMSDDLLAKFQTLCASLRP